jgi:rhomboid protease GluP
MARRSWRKDRGEKIVANAAGMAEINHISGQGRNLFRVAVPCFLVRQWAFIARILPGGGIMEEAGAGKAGPPWLTLTLLTALVVVFCIELLLGFDTPTGWLQPSVRTLVALGGSNRRLVAEHGEWYRLVSAPFLHGGLIHLGLNGLVLLWGGSLLERMLGRAWFAAIYAVSAVTGVLVSLAINEPSVVSVGASGALMGLMAGLFVASFHFPPGPVRSRLWSASLEVLVPSMIPVFTSLTGQRVDFGAHLGGALGGAMMALILLGNWPSAERLPRLQRLAAAIGVTGLVAAVVTVGKVTESFFKARHDVELQATLIPNSELPRTDEQWKAKMDALGTRYPHDPRPRLVRGITMLDARDSAGAERELRTGLADWEALKELLPPRVEALLRTNLAIALDDNRQKPEAKAVATPVCRLDTAENRPTRMRLKSMGLCD